MCACVCVCVCVRACVRVCVREVLYILAILKVSRLAGRERERERVCFMSMSMSLGLSSVTRGVCEFVMNTSKPGNNY